MVIANLKPPGLWTQTLKSIPGTHLNIREFFHPNNARVSDCTTQVCVGAPGLESEKSVFYYIPPKEWRRKVYRV